MLSINLSSLRTDFKIRFIYQESGSEKLNNEDVFKKNPDHRLAMSGSQYDLQIILSEEENTEYD